MAQSLKSRLAAWAEVSIDTLRNAQPTIPEPLSYRAADGAEPLLAIADMAGGAWPERARHGIVELYNEGTSEDASAGVRLLHDLLYVFGSGVERMHSASLCEALCEIEEGPWGDWAKGKGLQPSALARRLRPFGIRPRQVWVNGVNRNGYERADFEDSWARFLPSASETLGPLEPPPDGPSGEFPQTLDRGQSRGSTSGESPIETGLLEGIEAGRLTRRAERESNTPSDGDPAPPTEGPLAEGEAALL